MPNKIIQYLTEKGIWDKKKAAEVEYRLKQTGKTEEEFLLEEKVMPEKEIFEIKSQILGIPYRRQVPDEIPKELLKILNEEAVQFYKMVPISRKDKTIEIGMVYPENLEAQEALKFLAREKKFNYEVVLVDFSTFEQILKQYKGIKEEVSKALEQLEEQLKVKPAESSALKEVRLERISEEAPITKMVAVILRQAVEGKASDIHVEPTRNNLRIRYRKDGILHTSLILPLKVHQAIVTRIKILSNLKIDETRIPQDGRFSIKIDEITIDFRVSTFPTTLGEKVAIRVLDPREGIKSFEGLGLEGRNLDTIKEAVKKPYGMILTTGPTGSGKTTTLYAVLRFLNKEGVNIVTLEDPVEYYIEGVNQSQVRPEINYTFATGLRSIVRQDPDIIMVGEIRDAETASLAVHAALTGHIVLSTLHTNNAIGAIPRLIDLGIEPFLLAPAINTIIAQRLVRRICPYCKEKFKPEGKLREDILKEYRNLPEDWRKLVKISTPFYLYRGKGCKKCRNTGYLGRVGIFEFFQMTPQVAEIISKEFTETDFLKEAKRQGMIFMRQDGIIKVLKGITTLEEVLRVTKL